MRGARAYACVREREREKRVYLQLHELDYNHTKCEIQNTG